MKSLLQIIIVLPLLTLCVGCGGAPESASNPAPVKIETEAERQASLNFLSGDCGWRVIADYDSSFTSNCRHMTSQSDEKECKQSLQSFLEKYPRIQCEIPVKKSKSKNESEIPLLAFDLADLLKKLTARGN